MGRVEIRKINASEHDITEISIESFLKNLRIRKISGVYHLTLGTTEINISADLMKEIVENAFMMLDYEDQIELLRLFSSAVR